MRTFVRIFPPFRGFQWLSLSHEGRTWYPTLQHTTIDQNRPYGDKRTFSEHAHQVYHLVLYTSVEGRFRLNQVTWHARPGTLVVVSPGQPHDFVTDRGDSIYSEITFTFEDENEACLDIPIEQVIVKLFGIKVGFSSPRQLDPQQTTHLRSLFLELTDYANLVGPTSNYYQLRALQGIFDVLISIGNTETALQEINEGIIQVHDHIRQNYHLPLDIDKLADHFNMSRSYLFRLFKREYQLTPLEYQQQLRMEAARTLLRTTSLRCNEIALRIGYENTYYFHRVFKNHTGMTPRQFRLSR